MTPAPFKFDEIGDWSELKLEIVEKYGAAYTKAFARQKGLKKYYIDAFSGAGVHVSKRTGSQVEGSPARALKVSPPFDHFYFIDMNPEKTAHLAALCQGRGDVDIVTDDATSYLTRKLLPTIQYKKFNRALCLLDPYGLHLDWDVMLQVRHKFRLLAGEILSPDGVAIIERAVDHCEEWKSASELSEVLRQPHVAA